MNVDEDRFPPKQVQYFINANKEEGKRASEAEAYDDFSRRYAEIYAAYDEQCQREGVVDFAELLLRSFELLSKNEILREHYQARFRHILVDEFQDTNRLQYRWLKLLAGHGESRRENSSVIFAVGDDDQSIYAFRGANVGNMADFERDFKVENVIRLEQNYRSHGNILDAANALISNNRKRLGKNLWTAAGHGEPLRDLRRRRPTATRPTGWPRKCRRSTATGWRGARSACSTAPTRSRAFSSTRCSPPAFPTASTAGCAFSSAWKSSTRWPICG